MYHSMAELVNRNRGAEIEAPETRGKMFANYSQMASVCPRGVMVSPDWRAAPGARASYRRHARNMFDRSFGLGVEEKVFILTHLIGADALWGAGPLWQVLRRKGQKAVCLAASGLPIIAAIKASVMGTILFIFGGLPSDVAEYGPSQMECTSMRALR